MKKILLFFCLFGLTTLFVQAQERGSTPSAYDLRMEELYGQAPESEPLPASIQLFNLKRTGGDRTYTQDQGYGMFIPATGVYKGKYYEIDFTNGATVEKKMYKKYYFCAAEYVYGDTPTVYAFANDLTQGFNTVDIETGEETKISSVSKNMTDMTYNYHNNTMYGVKYGKVYSIDLSNGAGTLVYNGGTLQFIAIAADLDGTIYAVTLSTATNAELYKFAPDAYDTAPTLVGTLPFPTQYTQSMSFDQNTGTLYWWQCAKNAAADGHKKHLVTVDIDNPSASTFIGLDTEMAGLFFEYEHKAHAITQGTINGGTITTTPANEAFPKEIVTIDVTSDECKQLKTLSYTPAGSDPVEIDILITPYTFVMPAVDVEINATFLDITNDITLNFDNTTTTLEVDKTNPVACGTEVTGTYTANTGYAIDEIKIDGTATPSTEGEFTFTMPDHDVTIEMTAITLDIGTVANTCYGEGITAPATSVYTDAEVIPFQYKKATDTDWTEVIGKTALEAVTFTVTGDYELRIAYTNDYGTFYTETVTFTVMELPEIAIAGDGFSGEEGVRYCHNETIELTATSGFSAYEWKHNGTLLTEATNILTIANATVDNAGTYTVTVNDGNCDNTASLLVNVEPDYPVPVIEGDDIVCPNETATLQLTNSGDYQEGFIIIWKDDSETVLKQDTINDEVISYTYTTEALTAPMTVKVTVSNFEQPFCHTDADDFTINIAPSPTVAIDPDVDETFICPGTELTLTATGAVDYLWSTGETTASITVNPEEETTYTVTGTDDNGCTGTDMITVKMYPVPTVEIEEEETHVCIGNDITLHVLNPDDNYTYEWFNGTTSKGTGNTLNIPDAQESDAGYYTVKATNVEGCSAVSLQHEVNVGQPPLLPTDPIAIIGNNPICNGESATLYFNFQDLDPEEYNYKWYAEGDETTVVGTDDTLETPALTDNAKYKLVVSYPEPWRGCEVSTEYFEVQVKPVITVTVTGNTAVCSGFATQLTVTEDFATYQWYKGEITEGTISYTPIEGATDKTLDDIGINNNAGDTTIYYKVECTDAEGCVGQLEDIAVTVYPAIVASIETITDTICNGESITLFVATEGGVAPYTYQWVEEGTIIPGETSEMLTVAPTTETTYVVTVIDANACETTANATITVNTPEPVVFTNPTADTTINTLDGSIFLTATPEGGTFTVNTDTLVNGEFNPYYYTPGPHFVTYETESNGCPTSAFVKITVEKHYWTDPGNYTLDWFYSGEDGRYEISTAEELAGLSVIVNGMNGESAYDFNGETIFLTNNINLAGKFWYPIGTVDDETGEEHKFMGTFEGQFIKTIDSLMFYDELCGGLFSYVDNANISNIALTNCYVNGLSAGSIADIAFSSTIKNCSVSGEIIAHGDSGFAGGIVGSLSLNSYITNCYNKASVNSYHDCSGGIVGTISFFSELTNCYNTGIVNGNNPEKTGAIAGISLFNKITNCYWDNSLEINAIFSNDDTTIQDTIAFEHIEGDDANVWTLTDTVTIGDVTTTDLLEALNAKLFVLNDESLKTWSADNLDYPVNEYYPVFNEEYIPYYDITINPVIDGSATTNHTYAYEGDLITITVTPDLYCDLDNISVTDADGNAVTVAPDNTFTMPASDVVIIVTMERDYWTAHAEYAWYGGTADDSYEISNEAELAGFANIVNGLDGQTAYDFEGKFVGLTSTDYDMSGYFWMPIDGFKGTLQGAGKVISNLYVREDNAALFNHIPSGGAIYNLGVKDADIKGVKQAVIAVNNAGIIENSYVTNNNLIIGNNGDIWKYYDDGTCTSGLGGGTIYWGVMFPASMINEYAGTCMTKIKVFDYEAGAATVNIYYGGETAPTTFVHTQNFNFTGAMDWLELDLTSSLPIDGTENVWVTFYQSGTDYPAAVSNNVTNDPNGRWVSLDGSNWMDLASAYAGLTDYTWMIRCYFETIYSAAIVHTNLAGSKIDNVYGAENTANYAIAINNEGIINAYCADTENAIQNNTGTATITPITDATTLLNNLNAWVSDKNSEKYIEWGADDANVNYGYPILSGDFFDPYLTITYNPNEGTPYEGCYISGPSMAHQDDEITVTSNAATGYELTGLTYTDGVNPPVDIDLATMTFEMPASNITVEATYALKNYNITYATVPNGTVSGNPTATYGETVTVTSAPDTGYELTGLTYTDGVETVDIDLATMTFEMPASNITVEATYALKNYNITYATVPNGTVSGNPTATYGETVTVTSAPDTGYELTGLTYTDGVETVDIDLVTMTFEMPASNITVEATYALKNYNITYATVPNGTVSGNPTATYGETVTVTSAPDTGYELTGLTYTDGVETVDIDLATMTFEMPASDVTVNATFSAIDYTITYNDGEHGTVSGPETAIYNESVTVSHTDDEGWTLTGLTYTDGVNPPVDIDFATMTFEMPASNITIEAAYTINQHTLTIHYEFEDGSPAEPDYIETLDYGATYDIACPVIPDYDTPDNVTGTMPDDDVEISVTYLGSFFNITDEVCVNGSISTPDQARYTHEVVITVMPNPGYALDVITAYKTGEPATTVAVEDDNTFIMPNYDVTVTATFKLSYWTDDDVRDVTWYDPSITEFTLTTGAELGGLSYLANYADPYVSFDNVTITLGDDIDLSGHMWVPVGGMKYSNKPFLGTFNGNRKAITNMAITNNTSSYQALFGIIGDGAVIDQVDVAGSVSGRYYTAGIVGKSMKGAIVKNSVSKVIVSSIYEAAGIVAYNHGEVYNCYNVGNIECTSATRAGYYVGGIVAVNNKTGYVENCYNTGVLSATGSNPINYYGGVVGYNKAAAKNIKNCYWLDIETNGVGKGDIDATCHEFTEADAETLCSELNIWVESQMISYLTWVADDPTTPVNNGYPIFGDLYSNENIMNVGDTDEFTVSIYPNPTRNTVKIEALGIRRITVYNVFGQIVIDEEIDSNWNMIDMSNYANGTYLFKIVTENGVTTKNVIVTK